MPGAGIVVLTLAVVALVLLYRVPIVAEMFSEKRGKHRGKSRFSRVPKKCTITKKSATYERRVPTEDGGWACPAGTRDTGCTWGDGENEDRQCLVLASKRSR